MAKAKKHVPAVPVEEWPNYQVLATRCRHAGLEPTYPNLKIMDDPRLESLAGRLSIRGKISGALFQVAMDMGGLESAWKRKKGIPQTHIINKIWLESPSDPSDFDARDITAALDDEASLARIEKALGSAYRALLDAGSAEYICALSLIHETFGDHHFVREVDGVTMLTTKGEHARNGLRALAEHFGIDDEEDGA